MLFDQIEETDSVLIVAQSVSKDSIDFMTPKADQFVGVTQMGAGDQAKALGYLEDQSNLVYYSPLFCNSLPSQNLSN